MGPGTGISALAIPASALLEERSQCRYRTRSGSQPHRLPAILSASESYEALMQERGEEERIWGSMIKQTLKRKRPGFNESSNGFRSIGELLEEARSRGLVNLQRDEKSGGYLVTAHRSASSGSTHRRSSPLAGGPVPVPRLSTRGDVPGAGQRRSLRRLRRDGLHRRLHPLPLTLLDRSFRREGVRLWDSSISLPGSKRKKCRKIDIFCGIQLH